ncbi:MAG: zinc ribbon domain-containing protein [Gammaproteobacteria bacterium]
MPTYDYFCGDNGHTVEVTHSINETLKTWGEVCYTAQIPLGDTDPLAPVEKVISAPVIAVPLSDARIKEKGFVKLVKRDTGVYENVTALDHEKRYVKTGDKESLPDLKSRIED